MPFTSQIYPGELVIDDHNFSTHCAPPAGMSRGLFARDWISQPYGSFCAPSSDADLIDESEWDDRIKEMEQTQSRLSDLINRTYTQGAPLTALNQGNTNYCWFNAMVAAVELTRLVANAPMLRLSPASGAAPKKNFTNSGGWASESLEWFVDNGCNTVDEWPPNAIDRVYYTQANKERARRNKVTEWNDLPDRSFKYLMSYLLRRRPVAVGYNWWSHEVCACDPLKLGDNKYGIRIRNSWSDSYGYRGMAVIAYPRAIPDDAVSPRVALPPGPPPG